MFDLRPAERFRHAHAEGTRNQSEMALQERVASFQTLAACASAGASPARGTAPSPPMPGRRGDANSTARRGPYPTATPSTPRT